jgi:hypothetical protein
VFYNLGVAKGGDQFRANPVGNDVQGVFHGRSVPERVGQRRGKAGNCPLPFWSAPIAGGPSRGNEP